MESNFWDIPVSMKSDKTGIGVNREFSIREILTWTAAIFILRFILAKPIFSDGSLIGALIFVVGYFGLVYVFLRQTAIPELYGYQLFKPLVNHVANFKRRQVVTGSFGTYLDGARYTGLGELTNDQQAYLQFVRGETGEVVGYGVVYRIVGTASNNRFDADLRRTIDNYSNVLRSLDQSATYSFTTNTGGQRVDRQIAHLFDRLKTETNPDIIALIEDELNKLDSHVRGQFVALHQYLVIRAETRSELATAVRNFRSIISNVGMVIRTFERPNQEDELKILQDVYGGLDIEYVDDRIKNLNANKKGVS